ncbi:MAG TPA: DUF983 domain-containing protein [Thermomicrobiales bacterium]
MRTMTRRNLWRSLGRGALLRCPRCGGRGIIKGWFSMQRRCPSCNLVLDRGESSDYWLGAYTINFVVAESVAVLLIVALILFTLPDIPWNTVQYASIIAAVVMPLLFFPFSRTLWLALDLWARPSERGDRARRSHLN